MPDKGQELFDIMDAALKRQREGLDATLRRQEVKRAVPPAEEAPAAPRRAAPKAQEPPQQEPPRPQAPASRTPAAPARNVDEGAGEATGSARGSSVYTDRLSRVPDSARSAPPAGTLSPGEVLRGTVFTSRRPQGGESASGALEAPAPAVEGPPRPASVRSSGTPASSVIRPRVTGGTSGRISGPVAGAMSGVRSSAITAVQAAPTASGRAAAQPAPAQAGRGFYVSVEMAVMAGVAVTVGFICFFFMGVRVGAQQRDQEGGPRVEGPGSPGGPDGGSGQDIKEAPPDSLRGIDMGTGPVVRNTQQPPPPVPTGDGKYTIEVLRFPANAKSSAESWRGKLERARIPGAFVIKRRIRGKDEWCVCVGRFQTRDDPTAAQLKQSIINVNRRLLTGLVEVVKLE
jgi:hypothetical protein